MNIRELVHHFDKAECDAGLGQLAAQQIEHHQGQDTVEGVHAQLLIGPVKDGSEAEVAGILQAAKIGFHFVLGAVSQHNLFVRPILPVIGKQNGLAQQRGAQLLVSGIAELEAKAGEAWPSFPHLGGEEVSHMPTAKDFLDLFLHSLHRRLLPPVGGAGTTKTAL